MPRSERRPRLSMVAPRPGSFSQVSLVPTSSCETGESPMRLTKFFPHGPGTNRTQIRPRDVLILAILVCCCCVLPAQVLAALPAKVRAALPSQVLVPRAKVLAALPVQVLTAAPVIDGNLDDIEA